jgi:predicted  nucleic acid-binding Zn-ribbon protein
MGKIEKKIKKTQERIEFLENEMYINLKQKTSNTVEISISDYQNKIQKLRKELADLVK